MARDQDFSHGVWCGALLVLQKLLLAVELSACLHKVHEKGQEHRDELLTIWTERLPLLIEKGNKVVEGDVTGVALVLPVVVALVHPYRTVLLKIVTFCPEVVPA